MSTIHIDADKEDIANLVIMPGDPLRAKFIAEEYLDNYKLVNTSRNMYGYTGYYKGKRVSVIPSGMGNASMGIYSYELYNNYDVNVIIRVGTCGTYKKDVNLYETVLVDTSYSNSSYGKNLGYNENHIKSSKRINEKIEEASNKCGINVLKSNIHNTDTFYNKNEFNYDCLGVEMETFALFVNAMIFNKDASALLTVSDNLVLNSKMTAKEREKSTINMIVLALEAIITL